MGDYWEENGIKKPQAVVVCAAIRFGDTILCGARHWDIIMRNQQELVGIEELRKLGKEEQGFINQFGEFLTREEAMQIAIQARQVKCIGNCEGIALFSEDLY